MHPKRHMFVFWCWTGQSFVHRLQDSAMPICWQWRIPFWHKKWPATRDGSHIPSLWQILIRNANRTRDVRIQNRMCFLSPAQQFFCSTPPTVLPPNIDGAIIAHTVSANRNNRHQQTPLSRLLQLPQPSPCPSPSVSIISHVVDCYFIIVICCLRCHPRISSRVVGCCFHHFVFGVIMLPHLSPLLLMITTTFFRLIV